MPKLVIFGAELTELIDDDCGLEFGTWMASELELNVSDIWLETVDANGELAVEDVDFPPPPPPQPVKAAKKVINTVTWLIFFIGLSNFLM